MSNCIQFIEKKNRRIVDYLLSNMRNYIDVVVPRGGKSLVQKVQNYQNKYNWSFRRTVPFIY